MAGELDGKVAVISGASRGIGRAIAIRLAEDGCDCLLAARGEDDLRAVAGAIGEATGRRAEVCATDLRSLAGCTVVREAAEAAFGGADILINCAGATKGGLFVELADEVWEDGFALKFYACVRLSRLFWPSLKERRGTVVNIVGGFARTPDPDFMIGGAVNAAMANFTKALAGLGLRDDVNVNAIHPGMTVTERLVEIMATRAAQAGSTPAEVQQASIAKEGIRRLGRTEDVANLVAFLCAPAARHIQGAAISIDGGATAGVY